MQAFVFFVFVVVVVLNEVGKNEVNGFGSFACSTTYKFSGLPEGGSQHTPANTKICFIGDNNRHMVLDVVDGEGCEAVVHAGDFDYWDDPELFMKQIWDVLPDDFPYFVTAGNHDVDAWQGENGYQKLLMDQLIRSGQHVYCSGEVGINQICSYKGILLLGTAVGTCSYSAPSHIDYIDSTFRTFGSKWKICSHHKNQRLYQVGGKNDETGYAVLDACRQHGAILQTAHEHSYARTFEMANFQNFVYDSDGFHPVLRSGVGGTSFLFVSGLGGESIREWEEDLEQNPWWASSATILGCKGYCEDTIGSTPVMDGALVCNFNNNGNIDETYCYFKDIAGRVFDAFYIYSEVSDAPSANNADLSCAHPFLEFTVTNEANDYEILSSTVESESVNSASIHSKILSFNKRTSLKMTVSNISINSGSGVIGSWLQFYSASNSDTKGKIPEVTIRAIHENIPTKETVAWVDEAEDWEFHTVWVSNNIGRLIEEIINRPTWKSGDDITFIISVNDDIDRQVYSLDNGSWYAPTLAVELYSSCQQQNAEKINISFP